MQPASCPHNAEISCANCRLSGICLPIAIAHDEVVKLEQIVKRGKPLQKGDYLYRQEGEFKSIYAVRSGTLKGYRVTDSGDEQVTGFYLPGEIIGIDGISNNQYASSAVALNTSAVCEIPFERLESLSLQLPSLQRHFFQIMSQEIGDDQKLLTLINKNSADERVAAMLLSLSARYKRRNLSSERFVLPMSRTDIGNFLGLTIETVSRVFSRFKQSSLVEIQGKEIQILDIDQLKVLAKVSA
jgi:CRP/FNR family transcriptional regulator